MSIDEVKQNLQHMRVVDARFSWNILFQKIAVAVLVCVAVVYLFPLVPFLAPLEQPLILFVVAIVTSIINDLQSFYGIKQDGSGLSLSEDEDSI